MNNEEMTTWELLRETLETGDEDQLRAVMADLPTTEATQAMLHLDQDEQKDILVALDPADAADLIEEYPDQPALDLIETLSADEAASILEEVESDVQADLLQEIDEKDVAAILAQRGTEEWMALCHAEGIPSTRAATLDELVAELPEAEHPVAGRYRVIPPPVVYSATPAGVTRHAPMIGEHGRQILAEVGYDEAALDQLVADATRAAPMLDFRAHDDVRHRVWRLDAERSTALIACATSARTCRPSRSCSCAPSSRSCSRFRS